MEHGQLRSAMFVLVLVVLLAGSFFVGRGFADRRVSYAQSEGVPPAPADPSFSTFACTNVSNIAVFENRIHVKCATVNVVGGTYNVYYYAYPTDSFAGYTASRMLAVGQIAFALDKPVWIYYEASTSYNPTGCNTGDCRLLVGLSMVE
jgi:hypothetical protein